MNKLRILIVLTANALGSLNSLPQSEQLCRLAE